MLLGLQVFPVKTQPVLQAVHPFVEVSLIKQVIFPQVTEQNVGVKALC
jgi:hypothetical protein